jgi:hypothetical protein
MVDMAGALLDHLSKHRRCATREEFCMLLRARLHLPVLALILVLVLIAAG